MANATPWFMVKSQSGGTQVTADSTARAPTAHARVAVGRRVRSPVCARRVTRQALVPQSDTAHRPVGGGQRGRRAEAEVVRSTAEDGGSQADSGSSS